MKKHFKWFGHQAGDDNPPEPEPDPGGAEDDEERRFEHDFREALVEIEKKLHESEDEEYIIKQVIIAACKFYRADWCGIMIGDPETGVWTSTAWYTEGEGKGWMAKTSFNEFEFFENYPRWVKGLGGSEAVIVPDCDALAETDPEEYGHYKRLHAHTVMGVPFGKRPTGFLVVRNATRYKTIPDFLRMAAYVVMSTYYLQELEEGRREALETAGTQETKKGILIRIFGIPEIGNGFGRLNARQYKSEGAWKILVYLALRERPASSREIAEALWPDADPDDGAERVRGMLYRLRQKIIKFTDPDRIIVTTDTAYSINWEEPVQTDAQQMEALIAQAAAEPDIRRRIAILKEVQEIYSGPVYAEFSYENWLRLEETRYNLLYLEATNSLLGELAKLKDYPCMQEFASKSLRKVQGNVDIYYWLFLALNKMGAKDTALKERQDARLVLSGEEIAELEARLEAELES